MSLETAKKAIEKVKLPQWVDDWRVSEELDSENKPMLQVWLEVAPTLDVESVYPEFAKARDAIQREVWSTGATEWVHVTLTNPIAS